MVPQFDPLETQCGTLTVAPGFTIRDQCWDSGSLESEAPMYKVTIDDEDREFDIRPYTGQDFSRDKECIALVVSEDTVLVWLIPIVGHDVKGLRRVNDDDLIRYLKFTQTPWSKLHVEHSGNYFEKSN